MCWFSVCCTRSVLSGRQSNVLRDIDVDVDRVKVFQRDIAWLFSEKIINFKKVNSLFLFLVQYVVAESSVFHRRTFCAKGIGQGRCFGFDYNHVIFAVLEPPWWRRSLWNFVSSLKILPNEVLVQMTQGLALNQDHAYTKVVCLWKYCHTLRFAIFLCLDMSHVTTKVILLTSAAFCVVAGQSDACHYAICGSRVTKSGISPQKRNIQLFSSDVYRGQKRTN